MIYPEVKMHLLYNIGSASNPILQGGGAFMSDYNYHIGVDYHKRFSYMVVKDSTGKTLKSGTVLNTRGDVSRFLEKYNESSHAVLEATRNWTVMHDWLEEELDDVVLANPFRLKAIAEAKIKTDKIDANILSDLLRVDLIPTAHVPSLRSRSMRQVLRERMFFVKMRTMTKNRVHTLFDKYPEQVKELKRIETDLFGKAGREQLKKLKVSEVDRTVIDREVAFIDELYEYIKKSEETIKQYSKGNGNVTRLKSIPGIGEFLARLIEAEIDDVNRFPNAKKLSAYAGLVPSTYSSGGKTFNGRIIKGGNKWLRWAFVEAVIPAVRSDEWIRQEYEKLKEKKGYNKAKVAVARKLLEIAYKVLKEGREYRKFNSKEVELKNISRLS